VRSGTVAGCLAERVPDRGVHRSTREYPTGGTPSARWDGGSTEYPTGGIPSARWDGGRLSGRKRGSALVYPENVVMRARKPFVTRRRRLVRGSERFM